MYSVNARRNEASPNRMTLDRHSCRREHTQRSAKAFRFGLRGGSANGSTPLDRRTSRNATQNFASSGESVGDVACSVRGVVEEKVKLPTGGIKRALLLFFRFEGVDERATFIVDPVVQDF